MLLVIGLQPIMKTRTELDSLKQIFYEYHPLMLPAARSILIDEMRYCASPSCDELTSSINVDGCYSSKFFRSSARRFLLEILAEARGTK